VPHDGVGDLCAVVCRRGVAVNVHKLDSSGHPQPASGGGGGQGGGCLRTQAG
jgi:hypothetical protein